jgi:hypothetical protein
MINAATNCGPVDPNKCYVILNRKTSKALTVVNGKLNDRCWISSKAI